MKLKKCPKCNKSLSLDNFTSTRAKFCRPCTKIHQLELRNAMIQRSLDRTKVKKQKTKGIVKTSDLKKTTQRIVNKWIRERDKDQPCLACGRFQDKQDASHFLASGSSGYLRYCPINIHNTCYACNRYKHGNLLLYRIGLVKKIGLESVEWLEENREKLHKYTTEQLKAIINSCKEDNYGIEIWKDIMSWVQTRG